MVTLLFHGHVCCSKVVWMGCGINDVDILFVGPCWMSSFDYLI